MTGRPVPRLRAEPVPPGRRPWGRRCVRAQALRPRERPAGPAAGGPATGGGSRRRASGSWHIPEIKGQLML